LFIAKVQSDHGVRQIQKIEKYEEKSVNELLELKGSLISTIDSDLLYDFSYIKEAVSSKTIWECINSNLYINELKRVYDRIEQELLTKEQRIRESIQRKFDKRIQIITLILTIPSVNAIVDILYQIEWKYPIIFPIGIAKLLWIIITLAISIIILHNKNTGSKER